MSVETKFNCTLKNSAVIHGAEKVQKLPCLAREKSSAMRAATKATMKT